MSQSPAPSLYEAAVKIYPRRASGRFARLRVAAMAALLGFYYAAPWILLGDTPLVLLDLPARRFHVFGLTLVPQDLFLLTGLLLVAALTLFFFTNVAGRVWCGFACPQTVWTEAFLWIEHFTEGDRYKRIKLDRAPWSAEKALRKGGKHALWLVFSLYTGLTFVAYFVPARELFPQALALDVGGWPLFWTLFYGFATWGNAGFMREQVCKYMCPYARFQSAMFDRDTLIVAYDAKRGEPRKRAGFGIRDSGLGVREEARVPEPGSSILLVSASPAPASRIPNPEPRTPGDCINCSLCVQVCPTGIDIRQGLQYECIACAACVDACDGVMDNIGKPRGLIRYTSERQEQGGAYRLLRPRAIGYGVVWAAACSGFLFLLLARSPLEFDVIRDRHSLYRELPDGAIENLYTLKISNKDDRAHEFKLDAVLADGSELDAEPDEIALGAGESRSVTVSVRTEHDAPRPAAVSPARFTLSADDESGLTQTRNTRFLAGG